MHNQTNRNLQTKLFSNNSTFRQGRGAYTTLFWFVPQITRIQISTIQIQKKRHTDKQNQRHCT